MQKHHYIPEFYLKQWAGPDGRLCEFSKPYNVVKAKMKHPGATGYSRGLYTIQGLPPGLEDVFENHFLSIADGTAAVALRIMLDQNIIPPPREKAAWTRFILTLFYRTPEGIQRVYKMMQDYYDGRGLEDIRGSYLQIRLPGDPDTLDEYIAQNKPRLTSRSSVDLLLSVMQSEKVGDRLLNMSWHLGRLRTYRHTLLTSDRPFVMSNGLARSDSHLVMPLSPQYILCIAGSLDTARKIINMSKTSEMIHTMNDRMARQARKFVYGTDDRQLRFVANRLGQKIVCSHFE